MATLYSNAVPTSPSLDFRSSVSSAFSSSYTKVASFLEGKSGIVIGFVVVVLAFVLVIVFILQQIKGNSLKKGSRFVDGPVNLTNMDGPIEILGSDLPTQTIGNQFSYSFWIYMNNFTQTGENNKLIFYRGQKDSIATANPIVMLDSNTSKMHFVLKTVGSTLSAKDANIKYQNLKDIVDQNYFVNSNIKTDTEDSNKHLIVTINTVPLNRWVHYVLSVTDNLITIYVDGELYAVKTVDNFKQMKPVEYDYRKKPIVINVPIDESVGNVYIGRNPNIAGKTSIEGHFSKLQVFNHALTTDEVYKVYKSSPYSGSLYTIGGRYGFRTPIYRLDQSAST
jgi:hypothetical protein